MLVLGKNIKNVTRSGVIPYTWCSGYLWFLLGIDKKTRDLTDFGGGRKRKESPVDAAYREFNEETCNMFESSVTKEDISKSIAIQDSENSIFFTHISEKWLNTASEQFKIAQRNVISPHQVPTLSSTMKYLPKTLHKHIELIDIKWVREDYFWNIAFSMKNLCMWKRIQDLFKNHTTSLELKVFLMVDHSNKTNSLK